MMKPVKYEISPSEIQRYLDEGRTRKEVCSLLEISMATLRRYVGPDPNRKPYTRHTGEEKPKRKVARAPVTVSEAPVAAPVAPVVQMPTPEVKAPSVASMARFKRDVVHIETLHGEYADYVIDRVANTISIDSFVGMQCPMDADTFKQVTREFMAIYNEIKGVSA